MNSDGIALLLLCSGPFLPVQIKWHPDSRAYSQGCHLT